MGACYAVCQVRHERGRACNGKEHSSVLAAGTGRVVEAPFLEKRGSESPPRSFLGTVAGKAEQMFVETADGRVAMMAATPANTEVACWPPGESDEMAASMVASMVDVP